MLTPDQVDHLPATIIALFHEFEDAVLADIARRLSGLNLTSAAWQVQRLNESGALYADILKELAVLTGRSERELRSLFRRAGVKTMSFDDSIYKAAGLAPLPLNLSPQMARILAAGIRRTAGAMKNLSLTTAITGQQAFVKAADLAYMQVSSGAFSYDQAIRGAVKSVGESGLGVLYPSGRLDSLDVAMRRTVLTGVGQMAGELQIERADEMGQDLVQVSAHAGARPAHTIWQGKIYSRSGRSRKYPNFEAETGYGTVTGLHGANCVLGDTKVSGPAKRAAYRREYSGEIIVLRTASGKQLAVTPNHPILTDKGWVAADLLAQGDNVIGSAALNGDLGASPNVDHQIPSIEDVFNSLAVSGDMFSFPISPSDFHGDASDGKVDVIFTDGFLRDDIDSPALHDFEEVDLRSPSSPSKALVRNGALAELSIRPLHSSDRVVGGGCERNAFGRAHAREAHTHGIGPVASDGDSYPGEISTDQSFRYPDLGGNLIFPESGFVHGEKFRGSNSGLAAQIELPISRVCNSVSPDAFLDGAEGAPVLVGNGLHGLAGEIELDNIVFVKREFLTSTHVYNLETEGGWYFANGIITHNCRHSFFAYFEGISEQAYDQATRDDLASRTVSYNDQELGAYEASQIQRGIERKIRLWKRQASALEAASLDAARELAKVREWQAQMRTFVRQTKLPRQRVRELV